MKLTEKQIKMHKRIYKILKWTLNGLFFRIFSFTFKQSQLPEPPYMILANHNAELDPVLVGMCFPHTYFVASEHLFNKGFVSKLLVYFLGPIPRMKGRADASTVLAVRRRLQQGCNICIFPEGNRSLDGRTMSLHPTTAEFIRSCKVPVVTYKLEGLFLSNPRWSMNIRKGKTSGRIVNIYSSVQLQKMSADEINGTIFNDIYEDAYQMQEQQMIAFKGKNLALGLESALYLCPHCRKIGSLKSGGDDFYCSCGMKTTYNEYGYFTGHEIPFRTYTEWYDWQQNEFKKIAEDTYTRFFISDNKLNIYKIDNNRKHEKLPYSIIKMNMQQLIISDENGKFTAFDNAAITGISMYSRNSLLFEVKQDYYEIKPSKENNISFNAQKYLHLYKISNKGVL